MIRNAYLAYSRYYVIAERAGLAYAETRAPVWASIQTAAVALSLTESLAYPPDPTDARDNHRTNWGAY